MARRLVTLRMAGIAMVVGSLAFVSWSGASAGAVVRFSAPACTPSQTDLWALVAADANGDGHADLIGAGVFGGIVVLPGRGDGNFGTPIRSRTATRPAVDHAQGIDNIYAADVNGDGRADLVIPRVVSWRDAWVDVLLNDGRGHFRRFGRYRTKRDMSAVAVGDVNSDGRPDIVASHSGSGPSDANRGPGLSVLLGTGAGRFAQARALAGTHAADLALADFNHDGRLDVVLTSDDSPTVAVRLGHGDGTFGPAATYGPRGDLLGIAVADLNADGNPDLVASRYQANGVRVMLGRADGTFGDATTYPMSADLDDEVLADLDGDGLPDVAAINDSSQLLLRSANGDGTLGTLQRDYWNVLGPLAVGDFNRDGRTDLAAIGYDCGENGALTVRLNWTGLPAPPCVPPDLTRRRLPVARQQIRSAGCKLARIRYQRSAVPKGRVISQHPRSGAVRPSHAAVHLIVSRGRE